jgi:CYTH domain-containing protein
VLHQNWHKLSEEYIYKLQHYNNVMQTAVILLQIVRNECDKLSLDVKQNYLEAKHQELTTSYDKLVQAFANLKNIVKDIKEFCQAVLNDKDKYSLEDISKANSTTCSIGLTESTYSIVDVILHEIDEYVNYKTM